MTVDPNRGLRDKVRSEEMFCFTLVDWRGAPDAGHVLERFMKCFFDAGKGPSVWLASTGLGQREIAGQSEVETAIEGNAAACLEPTGAATLLWQRWQMKGH